MWDNILKMISSSSLNTSFCDQTERTHRMLLFFVVWKGSVEKQRPSIRSCYIVLIGLRSSGYWSWQTLTCSSVCSTFGLRPNVIHSTTLYSSVRFLWRHRVCIWKPVRERTLNVLKQVQDPLWTHGNGFTYYMDNLRIDFLAFIDDRGRKCIYRL